MTTELPHPEHDDAPDALAAMLSDPALWSGQLDDRSMADEADAILAAIAAEDLVQPPQEPAGVDSSERSAHRVPQRWWLAAAAALVLAFGLGAFVARLGQAEGPPELASIAVELEPTDGHDSLAVVADVAELPHGTRFELRIGSLPPAEADSYYELWVENAAGDAVSAGSFHMRGDGDRVLLWTGVPAEQFPQLTLRLQHVGDVAPSKQILMTGVVVSENQI